MGGIYVECGKIDEGTEMYRKGLEGMKRVFGEEHPKTLQMLSLCGLMKSQWAHLVEAETWINRALTLQRRIVGSEHPDTLESMTFLSTNYERLKRYSDQERLLSEVTEIRKRTLGPEHPDTLESMYKLARTYYLQRLLMMLRGFLPNFHRSRREYSARTMSKH
jgi:hypothetical protein